MKELFLKATIAMALMGVALLSTSFFSSMNPSKKVLSERSQHDISSIEKGSYRTDLFREDQDTRVMIIHDWNGKIFTHLLPLKAGKVLMPDNVWAEYRSDYHCSDFRPELNNKDQLKKEGLIGCHDKLTPSWARTRWLWKYNGEKHSKEPSWSPNMITVQHEIVGNTLYVNR